MCDNYILLFKSIKIQIFTCLFIVDMHTTMYRFQIKYYELNKLFLNIIKVASKYLILYVCDFGDNSWPF